MLQRPDYDKFTPMDQVRGPLASAFARQALETSRPWLSKAIEELDVLDVGSGYGHTAYELAGRCRSVVGLEPANTLFREAEALAAPNLRFCNASIESLEDHEVFDFIVLDNVFEHLPHQADALERMSRALRPGGVLYILVPNKLWPIEAHYRLPFLSWLPLKLANRYLRLSGRGADYSDASNAPTWWGMRRALAAQPTLQWQFVLPALPDATVAGTPWNYRVGMAILQRVPALWAISKAFLIVAVKSGKS